MKLHGMVAMAKLPVLVEMSAEFQAKIDKIAEAQLKRGILSTSGDGNNASFVIQTALFKFHTALTNAKVTTTQLMGWEQDYRVHRSAPRKRTNVTIAEGAIALIPEMVEMMLAIAPDLRHVYHGNAINNKLVCYFAVALMDYDPTV